MAGKKKKQVGGDFSPTVYVAFVFAGVIGGALALLMMACGFICLKDVCLPCCVDVTSNANTQIMQLVNRLICLGRRRNIIVPARSVELTTVEPVSDASPLTPERPPVRVEGMSRDSNSPQAQQTGTDGLYDQFISYTYNNIIRLLGIQQPTNAQDAQAALREIFGGQPTPVNIYDLIGQVENALVTYYNPLPLVIQNPGGDAVLGTSDSPFLRLARALGITNDQNHLVRQNGIQISTATIEALQREGPMGGGMLAKDKVKVLGRVRNVIVKGRAKYVNVKGELMLLSEAKKLEKKNSSKTS